MTEPRIHPSTLPRQPRTWAMPAEPGPEVKKLRDHHGDEWQLQPRLHGAGLWRLQHDKGQASLFTFVELLTWRGPLTEVVDE